MGGSPGEGGHGPRRSASRIPARAVCERARSFQLYMSTSASDQEVCEARRVGGAPAGPTASTARIARRS